MTIKANAARVLSMLAVLALSVGMIAGLSLTASAADATSNETPSATLDFSSVASKADAADLGTPSFTGLTKTAYEHEIRVYKRNESGKYVNAAGTVASEKKYAEVVDRGYSLQITQKDSLGVVTRNTTQSLVNDGYANVDKHSGYGYFYPVVDQSVWNSYSRIIIKAYVYNNVANALFKIQYQSSDGSIFKNINTKMSDIGWQTVYIVLTDAYFNNAQNSIGSFRVVWETGMTFMLNKLTITADNGYTTANSLLAMEPEQGDTEATVWSAYTAAKDALKAAMDSNKVDVWSEINALNTAMQSLPYYYYASMASAHAYDLTRVADSTVGNKGYVNGFHGEVLSYGASVGVIASTGTDLRPENTATKNTTVAWTEDNGRAGLKLTGDAGTTIYLENKAFQGSRINCSKGVFAAETKEHYEFMKTNDGKLLKVTVVAKSDSASAEGRINFRDSNTNVFSDYWSYKSFTTTTDWQTYTMYIPIVDANKEQEKSGDTLTAMDSLLGINYKGGRIEFAAGITVESIAMQVVDPAETVLKNATTASVTLSENLALNVKLDASALNAFGDIAIPSTANGKDADNREVTVTATMGATEEKATKTVSEWRKDSTLTFDNIRPDQMGEEIKIKVTVAASGKNPEAKWNYDLSIAGYMHKLIETSTDEKVQNLAAAALKYGIAARAYTTELGESTTAFDADTTRELAEAGKPSATYNITGDKTDATWYSASLVLTDGVSIRLKFNGEEGKTTYTVNVGTNSYAAKETDKAGEYTVDIPVNPDKYNDDMTFVVKDGETVVSNTLIYSVAAYANKKWNSDAQGGTLAGLVQALMTYGDYAEKYTA